jgi:hypothetical protein
MILRPRMAKDSRAPLRPLTQRVNIMRAETLRERSILCSSREPEEALTRYGLSAGFKTRADPSGNASISSADSGLRPDLP